MDLTRSIITTIPLPLPVADEKELGTANIVWAAMIPVLNDEQDAIDDNQDVKCTTATSPSRNESIIKAIKTKRAQEEEQEEYETLKLGILAFAGAFSGATIFIFSVSKIFDKKLHNMHSETFDFFEYISLASVGLTQLILAPFQFLLLVHPNTHEHIKIMPSGQRRWCLALCVMNVFQLVHHIIDTQTINDKIYTPMVCDMKDGGLGFVVLLSTIGSLTFLIDFIYITISWVYCEDLDIYPSCTYTFFAKMGFYVLIICSNLSYWIFNSKSNNGDARFLIASRFGTTAYSIFAIWIIISMLKEFNVKEAMARKSTMHAAANAFSHRNINNVLSSNQTTSRMHLEYKGNRIGSHNRFYPSETSNLFPPSFSEKLNRESSHIISRSHTGLSEHKFHSEIRSLGILHFDKLLMRDYVLAMIVCASCTSFTYTSVAVNSKNMLCWFLITSKTTVFIGLLFLYIRQHVFPRGWIFPFKNFPRLMGDLFRPSSKQAIFRITLTLASLLSYILGIVYESYDIRHPNDLSSDKSHMEHSNHHKTLDPTHQVMGEENASDLATDSSTHRANRVDDVFGIGIVLVIFLMICEHHSNKIRKVEVKYIMRYRLWLKVLVSSAYVSGLIDEIRHLQEAYMYGACAEEITPMNSGLFRLEVVFYSFFTELCLHSIETFSGESLHYEEAIASSR